MGLADTGGAYEDKIARFRKPLGVHVFQDLVPRYLGIIFPVEVIEDLCPFDSGHIHEILDSLLFLSMMLLGEELQHELLLLF